MKRIAAFLIWTCVFLAILLAVDQVLVRVPMEARGLREVRTFYVDFRARLLALRQPQAASTPQKGRDSRGESSRAPEKVGKPGGKAPKGAAAPRFIYSDEAGNLQFAGSLEEVPARYRKEAKPLEP